MKIKRKVPILAAVGALAVAATLSASAQGPVLLTNGTMDTTVVGWKVYPDAQTATVTWQAPGVAAVTDILTTNIAASTARGAQCVQGIIGGSPYTLSADTYIPAGQSRHGGAEVDVYWYPGTKCDGAFTQDFGSFHTAPGVWTKSVLNATAPAGMQSALVMLTTEKYAADPGENPLASFVALYDNVTLDQSAAPTPTLPPTKTPNPTKTPAPTQTPPPTKTPSQTPSGTATTPPAQTPPATETAPAGGSSSDSTPSAPPVNRGTTQTPSQPSGSGEPVGTISSAHEEQNGGGAPAATSTSSGSGQPPKVPATGTGTTVTGNDGGLPWLTFAIGGIGLVALAGIVLAGAAVLRQREPDDFPS